MRPKKQKAYVPKRKASAEASFSDDDEWTDVNSDEDAAKNAAKEKPAPKAPTKRTARAEQTAGRTPAANARAKQRAAPANRHVDDNAAPTAASAGEASRKNALLHALFPSMQLPAPPAAEEEWQVEFDFVKSQCRGNMTFNECGRTMSVLSFMASINNPAVPRQPADGDDPVKLQANRVRKIANFKRAAVAKFMAEEDFLVAGFAGGSSTRNNDMILSIVVYNQMPIHLRPACFSGDLTPEWYSSELKKTFGLYGLSHDRLKIVVVDKAADALSLKGMKEEFGGLAAGREWYCIEPEQVELSSFNITAHRKVMAELTATGEFSDLVAINSIPHTLVNVINEARRAVFSDTDAFEIATAISQCLSVDYNDARLGRFLEEKEGLNGDINSTYRNLLESVRGLTNKQILAAIKRIVKAKPEVSEAVAHYNDGSEEPFESLSPKGKVDNIGNAMNYMLDGIRTTPVATTVVELALKAHLGYQWLRSHLGSIVEFLLSVESPSAKVREFRELWKKKGAPLKAVAAQLLAYLDAMEDIHDMLKKFANYTSKELPTTKQDLDELYETYKKKAAAGGGKKLSAQLAKGVLDALHRRMHPGDVPESDRPADDFNYDFWCIHELFSGAGRCRAAEQTVNREDLVTVDAAMDALLVPSEERQMFKEGWELYVDALCAKGPASDVMMGPFAKETGQSNNTTCVERELAFWNNAPFHFGALNRSVNLAVLQKYAKVVISTPPQATLSDVQIALESHFWRNSYRYFDEAAAFIELKASLPHLPTVFFRHDTGLTDGE